MLKYYVIGLFSLLISLNTFAALNGCDVSNIPSDVKQKIENSCQNDHSCSLSLLYKTNEDNVLLNAAEVGNLELIKKNIQMGVSVNYIFSYQCRVSLDMKNGKPNYTVFEQGYETLLSKALINDHMEIVDLLLRNGGDLFFLRKLNGHGVKSKIIENNNIEKLVFILKLVNYDQKILDSFLFEASMAINSNLVKALIENGANVNSLLSDLGSILNTSRNKKLKSILKC